jgi:hypothetical protein
MQDRVDDVDNGIAVSNVARDDLGWKCLAPAGGRHRHVAMAACSVVYVMVNRMNER